MYSSVIKKWDRDDAHELALLLNNTKILDNLRDGLPCPYTEKDALDYINAMLGSDADSTFAYAVIADNRVVGSVGAFRQGNIHSKTAEIGYYISEQYWGRGICTAAVSALCNHIFETTDIIRLFAEPFAHNTASCRVLEKCGFEYEGTLRSNAVKNGRVVDMRMYSKIKSVCSDT